MALIRLTGKHAVGEHAFAIVDDDLLAFLTCWKWKAKPNASRTHVYAVRNAVCNGRHVLIRMHRVVLGLTNADPMDVEHLNRNALDNRRGNLNRTTRSASMSSARRVIQATACRVCDVALTREVSVLVSASRATCAACKATQRRAQLYRWRARRAAKASETCAAL